MTDEQRSFGELAAPSRAAGRRFRLDVLTGPDQGRHAVSATDRIVIGTHPAADLRLTDPTVARFHCEIVRERDRCVISDLVSSAGTFVDGTPIMAARLRDRARLGLGKTQLAFSADADAHTAPASPTRFGSLVGGSHRMRAVFAILERAAASRSTVLITGPTGSGKDLAAYSLHCAAGPPTSPYVVVDCGGVSASLIESELYGHERGAFTGADRTRVGAFEAARGGSVFLDEIGELPLPLQSRLLRAIESREIQRVGSNDRIPFDARIIAATNRDLLAEVHAGRFRADLYFRLAVVTVRMPRLEERLDDLPALVHEILARLGADPAAVEALTHPRYLAELARRPWPGEIRELRNLLEQRVVLGEAATPAGAGASATDRTVADRAAALAGLIDPHMSMDMARARVLRHFEYEYVLALLRLHDGNVTAAAAAAGLDRRSLHRIISRCGLDPRKA